MLRRRRRAKIKSIKGSRELLSIIFLRRIVEPIHWPLELACKKGKTKLSFLNPGRVKSRGETGGEIHRNLQTIPQREEERNTESNSAGKLVVGGGRNDCSPPSPPSSKTFFSPWSFNFASLVGIHSFPVGLDHRGCKITPSAQLFTIFVRESGGFRHGSNGSNNRCVYLLCKRGTCSHARNPNNLISFLPHTAELWRPILSLINVPNNRGATWLQHGNSLGNWSERWRDFGYIERVCSSRAWNKFPFASSLSISFFSSFPPLCSDRSSFRIGNSWLLPRILRISVFLYSNPWDVRIFIKEETIRTILVNEKHGRKRKSWTLFN